MLLKRTADLSVYKFTCKLRVGFSRESDNCLTNDKLQLTFDYSKAFFVITSIQCEIVSLWTTQNSVKREWESIVKCNAQFVICESSIWHVVRRDHHWFSVTVGERKWEIALSNNKRSAPEAGTANRCGNWFSSPFAGPFIFRPASHPCDRAQRHQERRSRGINRGKKRVPRAGSKWLWVVLWPP